MRDQTTYNVIIGRNTCGDVIVLDYAFGMETGEDFHGVTGSTFYAVPKAQYRESMKRDNIVDSILCCGMDDCNTTAKAIKMYQNMKACGELEDFVYDPSYSNLHDDIRKAFGFNEKDYPIITCTGGGRMFDLKSIADLSEVVCEQKYIDIIFKAEDMDKGVLDYMQSLAEEIQADHGVKKPVAAIKAGLYSILEDMKSAIIECYVDTTDMEDDIEPIAEVAKPTSNDSSFDEEFRSW